MSPVEEFDERPLRSSRLCVRVTLEEFDAVKATASRHNISVGRFVRTAIKFMMSQPEQSSDGIPGHPPYSSGSYASDALREEPELSESDLDVVLTTQQKGLDA